MERPPDYMRLGGSGLAVGPIIHLLKFVRDRDEDIHSIMVFNLMVGHGRQSDAKPTIALIV
jgi:hypothetical protein